MTSCRHSALVRIVGRVDDGILTVWSDDLPGLLLASGDHSKVWADVPAAIEMLFSLNYGMKVEAKSLWPASDLPVGLTRGKTPLAFSADPVGTVTLNA